MGPAVRFREDNPADLARARTAVTAWRDQHPAGTGDELVAAVGRQFHPDYGVVLRAMLFALDRHRAREVTGITAGYLCLAHCLKRTPHGGRRSKTWSSADGAQFYSEFYTEF